MLCALAFVALLATQAPTTRSGAPATIRYWPARLNSVSAGSVSTAGLAEAAVSVRLLITRLDEGDVAVLLTPLPTGDVSEVRLYAGALGTWHVVATEVVPDRTRLLSFPEGARQDRLVLLASPALASVELRNPGRPSLPQALFDGVAVVSCSPGRRATFYASEEAVLPLTSGCQA